MDTTREILEVWFYRVKTLPSRQPELASSLCSMVSLWLVLIPAIILAIRGVEFDLRQLIIPTICALGLATVLFAKWKNLALKIMEQENNTKNYSPDAIDKIIGKLAVIAFSFQRTSTMLFVLASAGRWLFVNYISIHTHSLVVQGFCIFALLCSVVLNSLYIYWKRRLVEARALSEQELILYKYEYLGKFLFPNIFWAGCFAFFHWVVD